MKKLIKISTIGVFVCAALSVQGQENDDDRREDLEFGVKAGVNMSNVWDSQGQEFTADSKFGLAGGLFLGIPLGELLGVQPEILFSQKGFKGSGSILTIPYTTKRTTSYVDIPLQVQLKPTKYLTFLAGPQFSYLLHQKDEYTFGSSSTNIEEELENDNVRKNILGAVAGADIIYKSLVISGRLGWDFQNNHGDGTSDTPRYKNRWIQLTLGFKI